MLSGISSFCFFASYTVTLVLELSRLFFRARIGMAVMISFAVAGLFAHSVYLWLRVQQQLTAGAPLSTWHDWCLLVAWVVTAAYVLLALCQPRTAVGMFMLPLVLALIGVAEVFDGGSGFSRDTALSISGALHGITLLLGTVVVILGFVAGVMYLVQSYRLKHKLPPRPGLQLPSLERLQKENERALVVSSILLIAGLLAGIVHNLIKASVVAWTDPVVWFSGLLLAWLATVSTFNLVYKPARRGRKVAYLTVASFVVMALVLSIVLLAEHASS